ncbi:MAG: LacI family transcriptional regulator [Pelolinea sp.]|jgi:LacI family transcriptional regulator|nr:LacI family transcriptional regulator [Pelolinea sp.]
MTSIYDIAKAAGTSIATVSYVINKSGRVSPETAARVEKAIHDLQYEPKSFARALASGQTFTISIVSPLTVYENQISFSNLLNGVGAVLEKSDYRLFIHPTLSRADSWMELEAAARGHQMDGVILLHVQLQEKRIAVLKKESMPFVLIGRTKDNTGLDYVDADISGAVRLAVEHLIGRDHRKLCMVGEKGNAGISIRLIEQFKAMIAEKDLPFQPSWCSNMAESSDEMIHDLTEILSASNHPSAIFAVSDLAVLNTLKVARFLHLRVPEDVAVIGYADSSIYKHLDPPVSAVFNGVEKLGSLAAQILLNKLTDPERPIEQVLVPPELVQRHSV